MVVGHSGDVKDNTGMRLKEREKVNAVKTGRRLTTTKPGKLNHCRKKNTKGINKTKKVGNVKKLLGKLLLGNKGKVLRVSVSVWWIIQLKSLTRGMGGTGH